MKTIILGRNAIKEAFAAKRSIDKLLISNRVKNASCLIEAAKLSGSVVKFVSCEKIESYGANSQGVVAIASPIKYFTVEEILNSCVEKNEPPFLLICDGIEDPHNLGALLRTAEAAKVSGVIIRKHRSVSVNETVEKTSAGALNFLKIARVSNLVETIKKLKKLGIFVYCADACGKNYCRLKLTGAVCLVVGSEGKGVGSLVKKTCDEICKIPMLGKINSLNVSVAGGILMYEILRQRIELS